jgi:hypothetical protein
MEKMDWKRALRDSDYRAQTGSIKLEFLNCRGISSKYKDLSIEMCSEHAAPDLRFYAETFLTGKETLHIDGFETVACNRRRKWNASHSGGGLLACASHKLVERCSTGVQKVSKLGSCIWYRVNTTDMPLYICSVYMFQNIENENSNAAWAELRTDLEEFARAGNCCLIGDWNCDQQRDVNSFNYNKMLALCQDFNLIQVIPEENTRSQAKLDYILVSNALKDRISKVQVTDIRNLAPNLKLDHKLISCVLDANISKNSRKRRREKKLKRSDICYRSALLRENVNTQIRYKEELERFEGPIDRFMTELLGKFNRSVISEQEALDAAYKVVVDAFQATADQCIGRVTNYGSVKNRHLNKDAIQAIQKRKDAYKKYLVTLAEEDWTAYQVTFRESKTIIKKAISTHTSDKISVLLKTKNSCSRSFWKAVNEEERRQKEPACPVSAEDFKIYYEKLFNISSDEQASLQRRDNQFLKSLDAESHEHIEEEPDEINSLLSKAPSLTEVQRNLSKLKLGKAPGKNGISSEMLKFGGETSAKILHKLFVLIWELNVCPADMFLGTLIPLYKNRAGSERTQPKYYRPIALSCSIGKLLEKILLERLLRIVDIKKMLSPFQTGFRKGQSSRENSFVLNEIVAQRKAEGKQTFASFLDIQGAYDATIRPTAFRKYFLKGIRGRLWSVLWNTYKAALLYVKANDEESKMFKTSVGLRQGSTLSPLLFNLFIDDVLRELNETGLGVSTASMNISAVAFADDILLVSDSVQNLQNLLDQISEKASRLGLRFGISKSNVVIFNAQYNYAHQFILQGQTIARTNGYNFLGSFVNESGDFSQHLRNRFEAADAKFFTLRRYGSFSSGVPFSTKLRIYNTTVLSSLLFNCECVCPYFNKEIFFHRMETIYRKHIRVLLNISGNISQMVLYGETGLMPLKLLVVQRTLCYAWLLSNNTEFNIAGRIFRASMIAHVLNAIPSPFVQFVKQWLTTLQINIPDLIHTSKAQWKQIIHKAVAKHWEHEWRKLMTGSHSTNVGNQYVIIKYSRGLEPYLEDTDGRLKVFITKLRCHWLHGQNGVRNVYPCCLCHAANENCTHLLLECNVTIPLSDALSACMLAKGINWNSFSTKTKIRYILCAPFNTKSFSCNTQCRDFLLHVYDLVRQANSG